jgi:hypothetical protein
MSAVWFEASDPPSSFPFELGCRVPYVEQVYCSHAYAGYLADHVRGCSWEKKFRPTTRVGDHTRLHGPFRPTSASFSSHSCHLVLTI